jgi:hypothetical protein
MVKKMLGLSALLVLTGLAIAAEPIKVDLKAAKWKSSSGADLGGYDENDNRFFMYTNGVCEVEVVIPADGEYTITVEASCTAAEKEMAKYKLSAGDDVIAKEVALKAEEAKEYASTGKLKKGKVKLTVEFLNDKYKDGEYDLNLFVHSIKIEAKK